MAICSFNCAVTTMMVGYVLYTFWTVRSSNHPDGVLHPPFSCYWVGNKAAIFTIKWCSSAQLYGLVAPRIELVDPITGLEKESIGQLWPVGTPLEVVMGVMAAPRASSSIPSDCIVWTFQTRYDWSAGGEKREITLCFGRNATANCTADHILPRHAQLDISRRSLPSKSLRSVQKAWRQHEPLYMHMVVRRVDLEDIDTMTVSHTTTPLWRRSLHTPAPPTRLLWRDIPFLRKLAGGDDAEGDADIEATSSSLPKMEPHWIGEVDGHIVVDERRYPVGEVPQLLASALPRSRQLRKYKPIIALNLAGTTTRKLRLMNSLATTENLVLSWEPVSPERFGVAVLFEQALSQLEHFGFPEDDLNGVSQMLQDTPLWLLSTTFVVATLHMLFDILAFKGDIDFWRKLRTTQGISFTNLVAGLACQVIVGLYLWAEEATWLVLGPHVVWTAIQLWKLTIVAGLQWERRWVIIPWPKLDDSDAANSPTRQFDRIAFRNVAAVLLPLIIGLALRSLVYERFSSWWRWALHALVSAAYATGFALATPQLYINYRLKSVAHVPIMVFFYRCLNTFIDDLFAFIITMPTMHRLSVFRDDIIFFVYLYQRWIYPVDRRRMENPDESVTVRDEDAKK